MSWRFEYLADHPEHLPTLARWHHQEWGGQVRDWPVEVAQAELASHRQRSAIPTTIIALEGEILLGSASLLVEDMPDFPPLAPWLASVYLIPERRGRGLGTALVRRVIAEARRLGVGRLYLFSTGAVPFYVARGWQPWGPAMAAGIPGQILYFDLTPD